jgi:GNAT superfamily N-acetyltransferase
LDPVSAEAEIDAQLAFFQASRLPFTWKVFEHDPPPDLKERLAARGFSVYAQEEVMVLDLQAAPASLLRPPQELTQAGAPTDIRAITRPEQLVAVENVLRQVWGESFDWIYARLSRHLDIPGFLQIVAAFVDGQAASVGWVYFHPNNPFANLYGGATLPEQRGRGLYRALLAARVQEALRRGCQFVTVDAGPMSAPIVLRCGFQWITSCQDCDWDVAA